MQILKDILCLFPNERIQILEIYKNKKKVFYHYSYNLENADGDWITRIVWHNFEQRPHYDLFDEGGKLISQQEQEPKDIDEIVRLVKIFRKNLMNMDLNNI
jgi:hypothetical protein